MDRSQSSPVRLQDNNNTFETLYTPNTQETDFFDTSCYFVIQRHFPRYYCRAVSAIICFSPTSEEGEATSYTFSYAPINVKPAAGGRAWSGDLIVFVVPGLGHLPDLVLPGEGIFESFFARRGDI